MDESKSKIIRPQEGGQNRFVRSNVDVCFFGGILGGGKENPLSTNILTPNGWVKMGDIKVGDVISTPFNKPTTVLKIYPQGIKDIYTLKTKDGRTSDSGLEHLWEVRTKKQVYKYRKHKENKNFQVLTTQQLIDGMNKGVKYYIPIPKAQKFTEKEYIIHPYLLGVLIGDGCLTAKNINNRNCVTISNSEEDIIEKCAQIISADKIVVNENNYDNYIYSKLSKDINKEIIELELNTYSYNKFIPEKYLWGSIEQRRQLLYGLMDTDGCVESKNHFSFSTTSKRLADDFIYLCRSLGYIATVGIDKRTTKYTNGIAYDIRIQTDDIIFSSKKHLERYKNNYDKYIKNRCYGRTNDHVLIESITYKNKDYAQCIYVEDKDHLYIIDDFTTTHNTFGAILATAEPTLDPSFRGIFIRKSLNDLKTAGSVVDTFRDAFGDIIRVKSSENPRMTFPSGAYVEARQVQNEDPKKIVEEWKGVQADCIEWEELTSYSWHTFTYIMSRCRGRAKWTGKIRATLNPKKNHWVRKWLDWYIDPVTGYAIPERDGVIRYFYLNGNDVNDLVWGDTKKEVYYKCKIDIDRKINKLGGDVKYEDLIKSFTFYKGSLAENKKLLENNPGYVGSVTATGGKTSQILIEGNWNVDEEDETEAPISNSTAREIFEVEPLVNGDRWITADLADKGTDNFLAIVWDGLHIIDILIKGKTTPRENAEILHDLATRYDIADCHIIFDGNNGAYINDYIPDAVPFISYYPPVGLYARKARSRKDEAYQRLVYLINEGLISFNKNVANRIYYHQLMKEQNPISTEFIEECSVVRFKDENSGKKRLLTKKEMNQALGKGRSMDLLDPIAMRMFPLAMYEYGTELEKTAKNLREEESILSEYQKAMRVNIFDDSVWA